MLWLELSRRFRKLIARVAPDLLDIQGLCPDL